VVVVVVVVVVVLLVVVVIVIVREIAAISEDVLQATFANMKRRVQLCLDSGGEHFQHLL
jgi:uncharacterized protein HemY